MKTAVVVSGGDRPPGSVRSMLPPDAYVVAADSGLDHALELGLAPDVVVGDMDSVRRSTLDALDDRVEVQVHPVDKDASDLELALRTALTIEPDEVIVVGGHGGRIDHLLANVGLLASEELAGVGVRWLAGRDLVIPVRGSVTVQGRARAVVSLVPVGGMATGVRTEGLRWELSGSDLDPTSTRSISNEFVGTEATVSVGEGTLLVIIPEAVS